MATRKVTGILYGQDGTLQTGKKITATLVDLSGTPTAAWDISTADEKRVLSLRQSVITDAVTAAFSFDLTPNDHISPATQYVIQVSGSEAITATLLASDLTDLDWYDFAISGTPLTPAELSAFQDHLAAPNIHRTITVSNLAPTGGSDGDIHIQIP